MIGALYLACIVLSAIGVHGLVKRFSLPVSREVLLPVTVITTVAFLLVDAVGIWRGWFATPLSSTLLMLPGRGALDAGLPIEEIALLAALASLVVVLMSARRPRPMKGRETFRCSASVQPPSAERSSQPGRWSQTLAASTQQPLAGSPLVHSFSPHRFSHEVQRVAGQLQSF